MPQCFCSSLGWFSAFVLKRLRCTLLTWLLLLWMIILFKANGEKKKRKNRSAFCQRTCSYALTSASDVETLWLLLSFLFYNRGVVGQHSFLSLSFSSFFSSSGEMSWNVKMQNDGVQRGWGAASGVLSLSICCVFANGFSSKMWKKKMGGEEGEKKQQTKSLSQ